jgi:hypothetical protein
VDEETLSTIARECHLDVADATESLVQVVRYRVSPRMPLGWWIDEAARWRRAGSKEDPPFLTVLAITVLAGTIVDDVNDRSYYRRLNRLLDLPGTSMPRYFDSDIQQLWTYLNEWLTGVCHGQLGTATASNIGELANVGWPQSQTLLRPTDRAKLPLFFSALGVRPGQLVDGELLVRRLRSWASGSHMFSRRLTAVLHDPYLSELLADALHSELAHWDGTLRDEAGRTLLRLLLAFHERSGHLETAIQVPEQLAETTWRSPFLSAPVTLASAGELQLVSISVTAEMLDGLQFRAEPCGARSESRGNGRERVPSPVLRFVMPQRDLHLLCPDDRLARWVEVPGALLHRPHLVLVRSEIDAAATDAMKRLGGDPQPVKRIHRPNGWESYRFTPTRSYLINGQLAALSPRGNDLSALDSGLPISKRQRLYLRVGPPDLIVDLREQTSPVTVDGNPFTPDSAGRLRLADLGLSAGLHSVSVGGVHYRLRLVEEFAECPQDTSLSFVFDLMRDQGGHVIRIVPAEEPIAAHHQEPEDVTVSGADIRASPSAREFAPLPHPPRVRSGGRHFLMGQPGQVFEVHAETPRWIRSLPVRLTPHLIDAGPVLEDLTFSPEWLLRASHGAVTVSSIPPSSRRGSRGAPTEASSDLWSRVLPHIAAAVPDADDAAAWLIWKQAACAEETLPDLSQQ